MIDSPVKPRILIVDDDADIREMICDILESRGAIVTQASNGEEAVKAAATSIFDLCVMDVSMPGMDGLQACAKMREMPHTQELPVMFLTSNADPSIVQCTFQAGGTDFMSKPVNVALLWHRISILVQLAHLNEDTKRMKAVIQCIDEMPAKA